MIHIVFSTDITPVNIPVEIENGVERYENKWEHRTTVLFAGEPEEAKTVLELGKRIAKLDAEEMAIQKALGLPSKVKGSFSECTLIPLTDFYSHDDAVLIHDYIMGHSAQSYAASESWGNDGVIRSRVMAFIQAYITQDTTTFMAIGQEMIDDSKE